MSDAHGRTVALWRIATWSVLLILTVAVALTFRDYGISHDEFVQHTYGRLLWDFYLSGFADRAVFDYIDLYRYGGLFDLVATAAARLLPFAEYDTRHLLSALCGIVGIAGAGRLATLLAGPRAGFFAVALLALTSSYYGSMFNNTKDIPFAAGMIWTLYYAVRVVTVLPKPGLALALKFGAAFGLTIGIRVGVMMIPVYLSVAIAIWAWDRVRREESGVVAVEVWRAALRLLPGAVLAYTIMAFAWPWAVVQPLNPLRALAFFSRHPAVLESEIFGIDIVSSHTPWYYIPGYLLVKLPELTLILFAIGLAIFVTRIVRRTGIERAEAVLVTLAVLVPLILFVLFRPTVFNGMRHFFFLVPPMTVMAALAADELWRAFHARGRLWVGAFVVILVGIGFMQARTIAALHPNQYVYYNSIAGGVAGAQDRFEMDYWSNSIREVAMLLSDRVRSEAGESGPAKPYKVALCTEVFGFFHYVPDGWFVVADTWSEGEFFVAPTHMDCDRMLEGELIVVVERMGALLAVVKDRRRLVR